MYDILMHKLYRNSLNLSRTLDTAWLIAHITALKTKDSSPYNRVLPMADDLSLKAAVLLDGFASKGKNDLTRIYSAIHDNLTLSSYLALFAAQLTEHQILPTQRSLLHKACEENEKQLRTLVESNRDEFTQRALHLINCKAYERTAIINGYFNIGIFTDRADMEAIKKEIFEQAKTAQGEISSTLAYWKNEIDKAMASWKLSPLSPSGRRLETYSTNTAANQSAPDARSSLPLTTASNPKLRQPGSSAAKIVPLPPSATLYQSSPALNPTENRIQLRLQEITAAYAKDYPSLQNQRQTQEQIARLLPHNLQLEKRQEDELLAKITACICIRYQRTRFVTKLLPTLHLDEAALGLAINTYKSQMSILRPS